MQTYSGGGRSGPSTSIGWVGWERLGDFIIGAGKSLSANLYISMQSARLSRQLIIRIPLDHIVVYSVAANDSASPRHEGIGLIRSVIGGNVDTETGPMGLESKTCTAKHAWGADIFAIVEANVRGFLTWSRSDQDLVCLKSAKRHLSKATQRSHGVSYQTPNDANDTNSLQLLAMEPVVSQATVGVLFQLFKRTTRILGGSTWTTSIRIRIALTANAMIRSFPLPGKGLNLRRVSAQG